MHPEFSTLVDALRWHATHQPERLAFTFLLDGEDQAVSWTYRDLDARARAVAARLTELKAGGGQALVLHPPGLDLIAALFGCFYAGVAAVPTYTPPFNLRNRAAARFARLVQDARPVLALTNAANAAKGAFFSQKESGLADLGWLATDTLPAVDGDAEPPPCNPAALAVVQYTSGSTSAPRGVLLSHRNLLANTRAIAAGFRLTSDSVGVIWLPPYHDMGLVGGILQPLVSGFPVVLMAPLHALEKPLRWLRAVTSYRATVSGAPNFAYDLCVRSIPPEDRHGLDLGNWEVAFSGAEPVRAETLRRFAETFGPCGFRTEAFYPCYGLAESALFVTGANAARPPVVRTFDRHELAQRRVVPAATSEGMALVGCGQPAVGHRLAIVDPESGLPCVEGRVGEIWSAGPSVASGYWDRPDATRTTFENHLPDGAEERFLRTGDLGFVHDGDLFACGRLKDLLIIRGRNYYPQDVEEAAEVSHPALALSGSAAFAVEIDGEEQVVVACEVRREQRRTLDTAEVIRAVREGVAAETGLSLYCVLLLKPGAVPKTTSGKVQRHACREAFLAGSWEPLAEDRSAPQETDGEAPAQVAVALTAVRAAHGEERRPLLRQYLVQQLMDLLKIPEAWLEEDKPLAYLGVDSLRWVQLLAQLEADLGIALPADTLDSELTMARLTDLLLADTTQARSASEGPLPLARASGLCAEVTGRPVPLTPMQAWFLRPGVEHPERFSTVLLLGTPPDMDAATLAEALRAVADGHDAFRLRFHREGGGWRQEYAAPGTALDFRCVNARGSSREQLAASRRTLFEERPGDFDVTHGPLVVATWVDLGPGERGVLQLCFHHLICDGLSVALAVADLQRAYDRLRRGEPLESRRGAFSFGDWAGALDELAQSAEVRRDLTFWQEMVRDLPPARCDPSARPEQADFLHGERAELAPAEQCRFRERFPTAREQHRAFLAAFTRAWAEVTGQDDLFAQLEDHGRGPVVGRSPAATVGWFINHYPIRLHMGGRDDAGLIEHVGAELDRVPNGGLSHGLLTYCCRDREVCSAMRELPRPRLSLVYYGGLHDAYREHGPFPVLHEYSYNRSRPADISEPDLMLRAGQDRGTTWWQVPASPARYGPETRAALSREVGVFLRHVCS